MTPLATRILDRIQRSGPLPFDEFMRLALYDEICTDAAARGEIGPHVAMLKVLATELQQRICEFVTALAQEYSGVVGTAQIDGLEIDVHWTLMMSRPITIFGGANEVQRDILAKAVLGLPGAR